jgi:Domain of unknown function (DUF4956)
MKDHTDSPYPSTPDSRGLVSPGTALGTATPGNGGPASAPSSGHQNWASQRGVHLFLKLTIYYACVTAVVFAATKLYPQLRAYLPIGGALQFLGDVTKDPFKAIEINASEISSLSGSVIWISIAITGAVLTILPVSWTYMSIRKRSDYDQSLVETIMILPIAVTSLVFMVHTNLALAFGLTGIVAVVRFRNTLKSTGDALYILVAIGIGLSAGVGAMEVSIVMTLAFNYCFLILWLTDYGGHRGTRRYMRRARKPMPGDDDEEEEAGEDDD